MMKKHANGKPERYVLITGGAGFIGTNLAARLLASGKSVLIFDNLSRPGVEANLRGLQAKYPDTLHTEIADIRDSGAVQHAVQGAGQVFHFAAQVAVTKSLEDPLYDFDVNVRGTLNVLEALRSLESPAPLVFTSTNKVYGGLEDVPLRLHGSRYEPADSSGRTGVKESRQLNFHSPYGCSKGAADQYVLDYARSFGIPAVVFRMSCIYGPHQMGTEDQGWVAHFLIRALEGKPIVIYGDGMQVRDVLFVDDLVNAFVEAQAHMPRITGHAFNIGGGVRHTTSLLELIEFIGRLHGEKPRIRHSDWRVGDQRFYVSDTSKFKHATGWAPKVGLKQGAEKLFEWLRETRELAPKTAAAANSYEILTSQSPLDV